MRGKMNEYYLLVEADKADELIETQEDEGVKIYRTVADVLPILDKFGDHDLKFIRELERDGNVKYASNRFDSKYHILWKALYIMYRQEGGMSVSGLGTTRTALNNIAVYEDKFAKGLENFTEEEYTKAITALTETRVGKTVELFAAAYRNYINFVNEHIDSSVEWSHKRKELSTQVKTTKKSIEYDTIHQALIDYSDSEDDVISAGIALMALVGVRVSGNNRGEILEDDEITTLEKEDVMRDRIRIHGKYEREIPITPEEYKVFRRVLQSDKYYDYPEWRLEKMGQSKYFIPSSQTGEEIESYSFITQKMMNLKKWFKDNTDVPLKNIGVRLLKNIGEKDYYTRLINEGSSIDDASYRTCIRYARITNEFLVENDIKRLTFVRNMRNSIK